MRLRVKGRLRKTHAVYRRTHFQAERNLTADSSKPGKLPAKWIWDFFGNAINALPLSKERFLDSATHSLIIDARADREQHGPSSGNSATLNPWPEGARRAPFRTVSRPPPLEGPLRSKIQIVQMNATNALPDRGGIATYGHELALHLSMYGHETVLVTYPCERETPDAEPRQVPYPVFRTRGFDLRQLAVRRGRRTSNLMRLCLAVLAMARDTRRVLRSLSTSRPKILWPLQWWPESLAAWLVSGVSGVPYCVTAHGFDAVVPPTMRRNRLFRIVMNRAAAVFAVSRYTAGILSTCGVRQEKIRAIPNGVRPEAFVLTQEIDRRVQSLRARFGLEGAYVLLTVSRLARRKGHLPTIEAVAVLRERIPRLRYLIAGDGPMLQTIQSRVAALGLEDIVSLLGFVSEAEKVALLHACDVFVLPNEDLPLEAGGLDTEGFGLVFLEAAACGKPAVGGRAGGVPEAVADGETGILVRPGDSREVEQAVLELWADRDFARRLGRAARERVCRDFSWSRIARSYAETFEALI